MNIWFKTQNYLVGKTLGHFVMISMDGVDVIRCVCERKKILRRLGRPSSAWRSDFINGVVYNFLLQLHFALHLVVVRIEIQHAFFPTINSFLT